MSVLQVWLLVGIPVLALGLLLFSLPATVAKLLGYLVLGGGFVVVASVDRASAAVFGAVLALLYAAGQGLPRRPDDRDTPAPTPAP